MVPEKNLMEKAVWEGGVHSSLKEGSDQQGKSSQFDIKQTKATIFRAPVEDQLIGLLQAVLVEPGLHLAGDGGDVLHPQVHTTALEPDFWQSIIVCYICDMVWV